MAKISMGNGYYIETLEDGYKVLRCPDDKPNEMGHGIGAYGDISLFKFKKICSEWIKNREKNMKQSFNSK